MNIVSSKLKLKKGRRTAVRDEAFKESLKNIETATIPVKDKKRGPKKNREIT